ncbi:flagellar biosynthetic protein FliO [bacterium]|nr:flagellar biosynthetic protein FliO [bacterium]
MKFITTLVSALLLIQPVFADEILPSSIKRVLKHTVDTNYFSVLLALGVVILLIYITGIIYAKLNVLGYKTMKKEYKDFEESKVIILSTTQLGPNKFLHVVEISGKKMLLGVSNDNITLLKDLSENESKNNDDNCLVSNELSITKDLDNLYKKQEEQYKEKKVNAEIFGQNVDIDNTLKEDKVQNSEVDNDDYGLYKKYL